MKKIGLFVLSIGIAAGIYHIMTGAHAPQGEIPHEVGSGTLENSKLEGGQIIEHFTLDGYETGGQKAWELKGDMAHIGNAMDVFIEKNVVLDIRKAARIMADKVYWQHGKSRFMTNRPVKIQYENQIMEGIGAFGKANEEFLQIDQNIGMTMRGPAVLTAWGPLQIFHKENRAVFYRDVRITDQKGNLKADRMDVFFNPETKRIKKVVAKGNVRIAREGNVSFSDEAVYNTETQSVKLIGEPKIQIQESAIKNDKFFSDEVGKTAKPKEAHGAS